MTCAELDELVWLAIDDELSSEERRALDEHVASCADCRRKVEASRRVASGLGSMPAPSAPAGFAQRSLARLDAPPALRVVSRWRPLLSAAAALLLVASFWGVWSMSRSLRAPTMSEVASNAPRSGAGSAERPGGERRRDDSADSIGLLEAGEKDAGDSGNAPIGGLAKPPPGAPTAPGKPQEESLGADAPQADDAKPVLQSAADDLAKKALRDEESQSKDDESRARAVEETAGAAKAEGEKQDHDELEESARDAKKRAAYGDEADAGRDGYGVTPLDTAVREAETPAAALQEVLAQTRAAAASWREAGFASGRPAPEQAQDAKDAAKNETKEVRAEKAPAEAAPELRRQDAKGEEAAAEQLADAQKDARLEAPAVVYLALPSDDPVALAWVRSHVSAAKEGAVVVVDAPSSELAALEGAFAQANRKAELSARSEPSEPMTATAWLERAAKVLPADLEEAAKLKKAPELSKTEPPPTNKPGAPATKGPPTTGSKRGETVGPGGTAGKGRLGASRRGAPPADGATAPTTVRIVLLLEPPAAPAAPTGERR